MSEGLHLETVARGDTRALPQLAALLLDAVAHQASLGFLAALDEAEADAYWQAVLARLGPTHRLWILSQGGQLLGTAQLSLCEKPNGRHRAEVQKLMVHSSARGRGLASVLMQALERAARLEGCSLLVLDTEAGSLAETVYRHLGWLKAGEIPRYAASPDGQLAATALYYKLLDEDEPASLDAKRL
ncbi:GNAT family N-acetyltransferase [Paucibacter sp. PLA-PC-4]|uniref:GNAT family N-acetyltransferase n=1 Tax=Paucibacter sp. PLA-PC-4 TaxID=2993655 RepID=UPI0022488F09|nr:GNAT family N-acetyltransferase [Paucibacter sp. PLA-PC-4]MCX2862877.1 GNAT family N-acetyltransferase [Paucibacter sp. PLA-PC-4]